MKKENLQKLIDLTAKNFKFKLDDDFKVFFDMIYNQIKDIPDEVINKKFQQLWLKTNDEWNKQYGYSGYPSLSSWLEILKSKPLTDEQILKKKKDHEKRIKFLVASVAVWISDPNLEYSFVNKYKDPDNKHIVRIINQVMKVEEELPLERIKDLGLGMKVAYDKDKNRFFAKLKKITEYQNQLLIN
jgi:hypothetical protein